LFGKNAPKWFLRSSKDEGETIDVVINCVTFPHCSKAFSVDLEESYFGAKRKAGYKGNIHPLRNVILKTNSTY